MSEELDEELEDEEPEEEKEPTNVERLVGDYNMDEDEAEKLLDTFDYDDIESFLSKRRHDEPVAILLAAIDCDVQISDIDEAYQGQHDSDEEFAQETAEQLGEIDKDVHWPYTCIDWERAARDLMMDYSESNGHYFRRL